MGVVIYSAYAAAHGVLTVLSARQVRRALTWTALVILLLAVTLAYDNAVLALGRTFGEGPALEALSRPRFVIHAFVTPVAIAVVVDQARRLGVGWAGRRPALIATWALVAAMIALGVAELTKLHLVPDEGMGLLRYTGAEPSVPIPAIVTVLAMIVVGWSVRRATGWSSLFVLGVVAFIGSGAPPIDGMLVLGNLVEIAFVAALLVTERRAETVAAVPTDPLIASHAN